MKYLFLILLSFPSFACINQAPLSSVEKYITGLSIYDGSCKERPEDQCLCFDHIENWGTSELVNNVVVDPVTGQEVIDGKKLIISGVKKSAHDKAIADKALADKLEEDRLKVIEERIKLVKKSDLTSNTETADVLMDVLELLKAKR